MTNCTIVFVLAVFGDCVAVILTEAVLTTATELATRLSLPSPSVLTLLSSPFYQYVYESRPDHPGNLF